MRIALGVSYAGTAYQGWQSQPGGKTVQDVLEKALSAFAATGTLIRTLCAGRTDSGVHALNQVVHFDVDIERDPFSWVRGTNRFLPADIAVQWCRQVSEGFHARNSARGRRYVYIVLDSPVRPSIDAHRVGWSWRPLDAEPMLAAVPSLLGEHDFSAFRAADCQSPTPVKTLRRIDISRQGAYWRFEFEANAFLHHMVRNLMGSLIAVGTGAHPPGWMGEVLESLKREYAAPTFSADGLYFLTPQYEAIWGIPEQVPACDWLP